MRNTGGKILIVCAVIFLLAAIIGEGCYSRWYDRQPKFKDVTIELGSELPKMNAFLTDNAKPNRVGMLTSPDQIDISKAGQQTLTFIHGAKEETVTLTVVDTTAPKVVLQDVTAAIGTELKPEDFVVEITDLSETTVAFAEAMTKPDSYGDVTVSILVTDASGNETVSQCRVLYVWMLPAFTLELGDTLTKEELLLDAANDADLLDQAILDQISTSPVGEYTITSTDGETHCECTVTVQDTTGPELTVNNVSVYKGEKVELSDFVGSVSDLSGDVTTALVSQPVTTEAGKFTVTVEATDVYGNKTACDAVLEVLEDTTEPEFSGLSAMTVEKGASPNYTKGVLAIDDRDGEVAFTYDDSKVDLSKAGTYYVTYKATDSSGNTTSAQRKIVVNPDKSDTQKLVEKIAASLPDDPEAIRDYVREEITYNHNWGGDDPVWYGLKNGKGNCYVHALVLEALLKEKGYTTQLIWVTGSQVGVDMNPNGWPPHYWLIIYLDGTWWHIDATPGNTHTRYSLMNDEMRYELLYSSSYKCQRDWDRSKWPACDGPRTD